MRIPSEFEQLFTTDLHSPPFALARLVDRESAFLSCYLDMRLGKQAAFGFFDQKVGHIRQTLRGVERFNFDCGAQRIRAAIEANWESEMQGMAIFWPGSGPTTGPVVIQSAKPFDNRLVRFVVPELLPLVAQQQREPCFDLCWLQTGEDGAPALRYFENIGSGQSPTPSGAAKITMLRDAGARGPSDPDRRFRSRRAVADSRDRLEHSTRPLLVAVSPDALPFAADVLPDWATERLVGSVAICSSDPLEAVLGKARAALRAISRDTATRVADLVSTGDEPLGPPVTLGYRSTLDTLLGGQAEAIFIADWDKPGLGLPNAAKIEVCLEALRRGVRVILAESARLREVGGVACLCADVSQAALMPETESDGLLERVA